MTKERLDELMEIAFAVMNEHGYEVDDVCWGEDQFRFTVYSIKKMKKLGKNATPHDFERMMQNACMGDFWWKYDSEDWMERSDEEQLKDALDEWMS